MQMGWLKNLIFIYFHGFSEPPLIHFSVLFDFFHLGVFKVLIFINIWFASMLEYAMLCS